MFSSRCFTEDVPGMGRITGERWSSHASESCAVVAPCFFASGVERAAGACELACRDREPGDEAKIVFGAVVDDVFVLAVAEVVLVLHADDLDDLARLIDLVRLHFREADVEDLALLLQLLDGRERFFDRHFGIDAMKLPEVDALDLEAAEAHLDFLLEVFGTADGSHLLGPVRTRPPLVAMTRPLG